MFNFLKTRLFFFFMDYLEMRYWIYTSRDISLLTIVDTVLNAWFTRHYVPWFLKVQDEGLIWPHNLKVHGQKDRVVWVNPSTGKKCVGTLAHLRSDRRNGDHLFFFSHYFGAPNSWDDPIHIQGESSVYPPWKHFQKRTQKFVSRRFHV